MKLRIIREPKQRTKRDSKLDRMRSNRSFSEILGEMIWKKRSLKTLEIGFGTRDIKEKEILKTEIKRVEEEFQKWI